MSTLIILGYIAFTIFAIFAGYKLAMIVWRPNLLQEKIEISRKLIEEYKTNTSLLKDSAEQNTQWYIAQLNTVGLYLKEKHKDNYIFDQLNVFGIGADFNKKQNKIEEFTKIDDILDKISKLGWNSLTDNERKILYNQK